MHEDGSPPLTGKITLLFSVACGLAVASVYYAQPLLDTMADEFGIARSTAGSIISVTQVGYGLGLLLVVPLGDLLNRRLLVICQLLLLAFALMVVALAPTAAVLLMGMAAVGLLAVVAQVLVAYAAILAQPGARGRVVGTVTSGIVVGILLARAVAGSLADLFQWRAVYIASAGTTVLVVVLLARWLPRTPIRSAQMSYFQLIHSTFTLFVEVPMLRIRAVIALLIFAAITTLLTPMVLPLAAPPFSLTHAQIGLFGLAGAAGALGASRAGRMADSGRAQHTTGVGLVVMLAAWVPVALLKWSLWALVAGVIAIDFGLQSVHVSSQTLIYRVLPEAQSRLAAGYMLFYSVGCAAGALGSTLAYAWAGWTAVCAIGACFSACALGFWWLTRHVGSQAPAREVLAATAR